MSTTSVPLAPIVTLAQSLGLAYASGISPYVTMTLVGLMARAGWIGPLPGALGIFAQPLVLSLVVLLAAVEFLATLVPGVGTATDSVDYVIRPPVASSHA